MDPLLDPLQFTNRANRSVDDVLNMALHFILQHLDSAGAYPRILFMDFSSTFNTIIPALLQNRLSQLHEDSLHFIARDADYDTKHILGS
eukprot:superscaffoldBa00000627_g6167